jgi:hypothetical protein
MSDEIKKAAPHSHERSRRNSHITARAVVAIVGHGRNSANITAANSNLGYSHSLTSNGASTSNLAAEKA